MESRFQFFIEVDRETMKRIDVIRAPDGSYRLTTTMQFDAGWEKPGTILNFPDRQKLVSFILDQGVPSEEIEARLAFEQGGN